MSFEIERDVSTKFLAYDRGIDVNNFHTIAQGGLHNYGYTGISYAGDQPDIAWFHFEGDEETVNMPEVENAIDMLLNSFVSSSLVELKLETLSKINEWRDNWMLSWFPYAGHVWDCDDAGMTNIQGTNLSAILLAAGGQALPSNFVFRDRANNNVPANAAFMAGMGLALFKFRADCYLASWTHKYMVAICQTEAEVMAYNWQVGWPAREA